MYQKYTMAYANGVVFYGWSDKDALNIMKKTIQKEPVKLKRCDEQTDKLIDNVNKLLKKYNLTFGTFEGGLGSNDDLVKPYLYFGKALVLHSDSDDDIDDKTYSIKELKDLMKLSFEFNKNYPDLPKPSLRAFIVSDSK